jgi:hypothetical protein
MKAIAVWAGLLSVLIASAVLAQSTVSTPPTPEAKIPFANHGGIYTWQVVDDHTVLLQSQNRKWYRATLMSACFNLPFAETLGFESNADGSFDKFSSIKVHRQNCPLISLVETTPPPKKKTGKSAPAAPGAPPPAAAAPAKPAQ